MSFFGILVPQERWRNTWVKGHRELTYLCCSVPSSSVADKDVGHLLCEGVAHRAGCLEELTDTRKPVGGVQRYQVVFIRTGGERERMNEADKWSKKGLTVCSPSWPGVCWSCAAHSWMLEGRWHIQTDNCGSNTLYERETNQQFLCTVFEGILLTSDLFCSSWVIEPVCTWER